MMDHELIKGYISVDITQPSTNPMTYLNEVTFALVYLSSLNQQNYNTKNEQ